MNLVWEGGVIDMGACMRLVYCSDGFPKGLD